MRDPGHVVGIDLGGTNMQIGLVGTDGRVLARAKRKTKADEGLDAVLDRIADGVVECVQQVGLELDQIGGVGIGAPGAVDPGRGLVRQAVNLRWTNVPLSDLLSARLAGVPVFVDNDVNVAILGEHKAGAAVGMHDVLGVWVGTGIGGGLVLGGQLYHGHHFTAGEIGHMIAMPSAQPGVRSLEHNCSRTALVDRLARLIRANRPSVIADLVGGDLSKIKSKTLAKAFEQNDALTLEVVNESATLLGTVIAGVVTLLSLEGVVLGGGVTEALGEPYVSKVRDAVHHFAFPDILATVKVVASTLKDDAGTVGAAAIAVQRLCE